MKRVGHIFVLTGAGISAESGIPVFQGTSWRGRSHYELANIETWERDPALVWQYYSDRRAAAGNAQPNAAHRALAEFEKAVEKLAFPAASCCVRRMWMACMKPRVRKTWCTSTASCLRAGALQIAGGLRLPIGRLTLAICHAANAAPCCVQMCAGLASNRTSLIAYIRRWRCATCLWPLEPQDRCSRWPALLRCSSKEREQRRQFFWD